LASPVYRYKSVSLLTGKLAAELPLVQGTFSRERNSAGSWRAEMPLSKLLISVLDAKTITTAWAYEIVVERDSQVVYAGIITTREYDSTRQVLMLSGRETWCYFDKRFVDPDVTYTASDQGLILKDLLVQAAAKVGGDIRVDLPPDASLTTGTVRTISYLTADLKPVSEAAQELANQSGGFEFSLDGYWSGSTFRHKLVFGFPQMGTRGGGIVSWDLPGGPIIKYDWREDGSDIANEQFGVGDDGSGHVLLSRVKTLDVSRPLLQGTTSFRAVSQSAALLSWTQKRAARTVSPVDASTVSVAGTKPPTFGSYGLGDDVVLQLNDPWAGNIATLWRIRGWNLNPPRRGKGEVVDLLVERDIEKLIDLASHFDDAYRRIRILETHSLGIPFNPPTVKQTIVVDLAIPARNSDYPGPAQNGIITLVSGQFTIVGAGATFVLEGAMDAQMEEWDNTLAAPRRDAWDDVQGQLANPRIEWPFGLIRQTKTWRSASTAIAAGTYTARALIEQEGQNSFKVFGGFLRVTITQ